METEIIEMDLSTQRTGELINEFELLTQKLISIQSHLIAKTRPKSCRVTVPLLDTTLIITIPSRETIDSFMTDERNDWTLTENQVCSIDNDTSPSKLSLNEYRN